MSRPPTEVIVDWYDRKTDFLLEKYGPGPRIHYHTGIAPPEVVPAGDRDRLRRQLFDSQEAMLSRATLCWQPLGAELLDVGCGLGGTALFLASQLGARVTALSPVARHLALVRQFAAEAGVADRVVPLLSDAHAMEGPPRFDAALSFGSTTYFDREVYFQQLARVVRPQGSVFIEDTFLGRPELAAPFNAYWTSDIGWLDDYRRAAARSGFELAQVEDVSHDAAGFWRLSVAYSRLVGDRGDSIAWQSRIFDAYLDGGLRNLMLRFTHL